MNPRRFSFSGFGSRRRYRHRRNPFGVPTTVRGFADVIWVGVAAGLSMLTARMVTAYLGVVNPWARYLTTIGAGLVGAWAVGNFWSARYREVWAGAAAGLVIAELISTYLIGPAMSTTTAAPVSATAGLGYNPGPSAYVGSQRYSLGAYPNLRGLGMSHGTVTTNPFGGRFSG